MTVSNRDTGNVFYTDYYTIPMFVIAFEIVPDHLLSYF